MHLFVLRVKKNAADGFPDPRSARFARNQTRSSKRSQPSRQPVSLSGLARTFDAFEGYEDAAHQVRA